MEQGKQPSLLLKNYLNLMEIKKSCENSKLIFND
jgi:hypothetical protein